MQTTVYEFDGIVVWSPEGVHLSDPSVTAGALRRVRGQAFRAVPAHWEPLATPAELAEVKAWVADWKAWKAWVADWKAWVADLEPLATPAELAEVKAWVAKLGL